MRCAPRWRARGPAFPTPRCCAARSIRSRDRDTVATLIDEVTIKETSFLRDRRQLASIDWHGLCARAPARPAPRSCASGASPARPARSRIRSRCSPARRSRRARRPCASSRPTSPRPRSPSRPQARYRERSAQSVEEPLRSRYLERDGDQLVVIAGAPRARHAGAAQPRAGRVSAARRGPFHLILCRNVLIYFDSETCARVVAGLERALAPGGRLVLGAADALCVLDRAVGELHRRPSKPKRATPRRRAPTAPGSARRARVAAPRAESRRT